MLQRRLAAAAPELLLTSTDPERRAKLTESIGRLLLDAFVESDVTTSAPGRVRVAMQYIVDHCAEPITSADIAAAAGLSQRGLQHAFARAELPPPIAALRQARLEAVRTALLHADPTVTRVGEIATAWGFGHLGRFSGYYEAAFGEFPRVTLHRSA